MDYTIKKWRRSMFEIKINSTDITYYGDHKDKGAEFISFLENELNYLLSVSSKFKSDMDGIPNIYILDEVPEGYSQQEGYEIIAAYVNTTFNVYMFLEPIMKINFSYGFQKLLHEIGHHVRRKEVGHKPDGYLMNVRNEVYYQEEIFAESYSMKIIKKYFFIRKNTSFINKYKILLGLKKDRSMFIYKFLYYYFAKSNVDEYKKMLSNLIKLNPFDNIRNKINFK
jgi:hypothetical protein